MCHPLPTGAATRWKCDIDTVIGHSGVCKVVFSQVYAHVASLSQLGAKLFEEDGVFVRDAAWRLCTHSTRLSNNGAS